MIIGLLGGTFNPPHLGHVLIAQQVLDFTDCDEVWFVPVYGHTFLKPMEAVAHRVAMTQRLNLPHTAVSTLEIDHQLDGNTINLLPFLPPEHTYRFIIGTDNLPTFHLWGQWELLLKKIPFLVYPRSGYPNEPLYPGMTMINDEALIISNLSSTKIRERVSRGLSLQAFVPEGVWQYIQENNLYKG